MNHDDYKRAVYIGHCQMAMSKNAYLLNNELEPFWVKECSYKIGMWFRIAEMAYDAIQGKNGLMH